MKEYVNEMLIESARKKGCLCASDMRFNATTINNYMALFANKGGIRVHLTWGLMQLQSTTTWHCLQIKEESDREEHC
jgi:hypothetical protein